MSIRSPTKSFKEYYSDPIYKKKHLDHMKQKVPCVCGVITARCNMSHHKKTEKHHKLIIKHKLQEYEDKLKHLKLQTKKLIKSLKENEDKLKHLKLQTKKLIKSITDLKK